MVLSAGTFALVEAYDYPYRFGIQYRLAARGRWSLEPGFGAAFGPDGMAFLYLDLLRDFRLGERWFLTPSLAAHHVSNGGLASPNNGTESLVVFVRVPLGRPSPGARNP